MAFSNSRRRLLGRAILAAAACLGGYAATPEAGVRDAAVTIKGFAFDPAQLTVPAGARVTWTNGDDIPHTVTSASTPRLFGSPPLDTGDSYARVFAKPGTYYYFCAIHPHMQGIVVVR